MQIYEVAFVVHGYINNEDADIGPVECNGLREYKREPLHVLRRIASTVHLSEQSNSLYIRLRLSKTYEPTSK